MGIRSQRHQIQQAIPEHFKISLKPLPDELLSSWLIRTAFAHHVPMSTFCTDFINGDGSSIARRDLDFYWDIHFFETLAAKSHLAIGTILSMSLRSLEGALYVCNNCLYPPDLLRRLKDKRTHYGLLYCPICLAEDPIPYWRKIWRFDFIHACNKHNVLLTDRCSKCHAPVSLTKMKSFSSPVNCHKCGWDYRDSSTHQLSKKDLYGLKGQEYLLEGLNRGYFFVDEHKIASVLFFMVYNNLINLLDRGSKNIFGSYPLWESYLTSYEISQPFSDHCAFIYKNFLATGMFYHLFQDFPSNFKEFAKTNHLTYRTLTHDMAYVPFWYEKMIEKIVPKQNKSGREISMNEIIGAIHYLKNNNMPINKIEVARIIGCHASNHKGFLSIYRRSLIASKCMIGTC